jgi:16S rRNA (cytidine1402-2'-O)-methyltransferase
VCGPCAATAALSVSGFNLSSYVFLGFLPRNGRGMAEAFSPLSTGQTSVFYESPNRIVRTMEWLSVNFPDARICLCNDLTKKFERIYRGNPGEVLAELNQNPDAGKGEYTCAAENPNPAETVSEAPSETGLEARLVELMASSGLSLKEAVNALYASLKGKRTKKEIYAASLRLKGLFDG